MSLDFTPLPTPPPERDSHEHWEGWFLALMALLAMICVLMALNGTPTS